jgi:hypothetical protein
MKWKAKIKPNVGDKTTKLKFAWLPILSRENELDMARNVSCNI